MVCLPTVIYNDVMKWLWRTFLVLLEIFLVGGLTVSSIVAAETNFDTSVDSTYLIDKAGRTQVSHVFELKNTTANSYVKEYGIELTGSPLTDIVATNQGESLKPQVKRVGEKTQIKLVFQNDVVGEGQTRQFSIRYYSPDVAIVTGQVMEVRIPGVAPGNNYTNRRVTLLTPASYGQPVRIKPSPTKTTQTPDYVRNQFDNLGELAVSAFFGQTQTYNLNLIYHLSNSLDRVQLQEIALPPDTGWQKMIYHQLTPQPIDIRSDLDGNWLATYSLKPNQKLSVTASASAQLSLERDPTVYTSPPVSTYTQTQPFWPKDDPAIAAILKQHTSVQSLYQYVVNTLTYPESLDNLALTRQSALEILQKPQTAVCQDFTDLLVTLLRAQGIPARRHLGYGFAQNTKIRPNLPTGDILHSWPEFYDNELGSWHQVDPTWENTTGGVDYFSQFDLSHITFAINGQSSQVPAPVGAYGDQDNKQATVSITPTTDWSPSDLELDMTVEPARWLFWTLPGRANLIIKNQTGQGWYDVTVSVTAQNPDVVVNFSNSRLTSLLPFDQITLPITIYDQNSQFAKTTITVQATSQDQAVNFTSAESIRAVPAVFSQKFWQIALIGLAGGLVLLTLGTGSVLVYRAQKRSALRGQSQTTASPPPVLPPPQPT